MGLGVEMEGYVKGKSGGGSNAISWGERESKKGMVVGKNGRLLKKVGRAARLELAEQLEQAVHLELWVKVKSNWSDNEQHLANFGYESS